MITILTTLSWVLLFLFFTYIEFLDTFLTPLADVPRAPAKYGDLGILVPLLFLLVVIIATYFAITSQYSKQLLIFLVVLNLVLGLSTGYLYLQKRTENIESQEYIQSKKVEDNSFFASLSKDYKLQTGDTILSFIPEKNLVFEVGYSPECEGVYEGSCNLIIHPFGKISGNTIELYYEEQDWSRDYFSTYIRSDGTTLLDNFEVLYNGPQDPSDYYLEKFRGYYVSDYPFAYQAPVVE